MARKPRPWWWSQRKRWATTIGGERFVAPESIGKGDEHAAWAWHKRLCSSVPSAGVDGWTIAGVFEAWLAWDAARVEAGVRDGPSHQADRGAARRVCRSLVAGRKFGRLAVEDLTADHLGALLASWAVAVPPVSQGYRRSLVRVLKTALNWATRPTADRGPILASNPLAGLKLPAIPVPAERFASRGEAAAWLRWLWRAGLRDFATLQRCLIHTGARPREIATATWEELRWEGHRERSGNWMAILTRKRWKAARTGRVRRIYLPARICRALRRRFDADPVGPMFRSARGGTWDTVNLSTYTCDVRRRAIRAGVKLLDAGPDRLTNYRWRHTAATELLQRGVPVSTVAELLGTSAKQITATYAHLLSGHLGDAAEVMTRRRK